APGVGPTGYERSLRRLRCRRTCVGPALHDILLEKATPEHLRERSMKYRIGVDVGGTFTDFLVSGEGKAARVYKSSTTPENPAIGFFAGLEQAARDEQLSLQALLDRVATVVHGTTITTNAVLTSTGAKTGFITTKGFRDVLNMRRGLKEGQFKRYAPPPPLVPRHLICVVEERVTVTGAIDRPPRE